MGNRAKEERKKVNKGKEPEIMKNNPDAKKNACDCIKCIIF